MCVYASFLIVEYLLPRLKDGLLGLRKVRSHTLSMVVLASYVRVQQHATEQLAGYLCLLKTPVNGWLGLMRSRRGCMHARQPQGGLLWFSINQVVRLVGKQ